MKFGSIHMCCVVVAILVLFFLLSRVSMYTQGSSSPMTCTCTSASAAEPANKGTPMATTPMMQMEPEPTEGMMIGN